MKSLRHYAPIIAFAALAAAAPRAQETGMESSGEAAGEPAGPGSEQLVDASPEAGTAEGTETASASVRNGDGIESPKTMSGMSILGNEEAPKALVIVPWKSSELGETISLSDTLGDRAQAVDKDVFLRELRFYEIRAGEIHAGE